MTRPKSPEEKKIHRNDEKLPVRVGLAEEEREPAVRKLTTLLRKQDRLRADAKDVQARFRKELKDLKDEVDEATTTLEQGHEEMVLCEVIKNFGTGKVTVKRKDTGKEVKALCREITDEDKQLVFGQTATDDKDQSGDEGEADPLHD